eukprot:symbB.v1.2.027854.t1/scaffold2872.1/size68408/5
MHSGVRREISGLNEDRFVYVKALLIGRTVRSRRFAYLLSIAWMIQNACFVAVVQASLKLSSIKVSAVCTSFLNGRRYESHESYEGDEGDEGNESYEGHESNESEVDEGQ